MGAALVDPLEGRSLEIALPGGVLKRLVPLEKVDAVLAETGKMSRRERDLPARVMVYYLVAMAFYREAAYREVLRCVWEEVRGVRRRREPWKIAVSSAISEARQRLGWEAMKQLYEEVVSPLAEKATRGAWYRHWRLVTMDGSTLDVGDTAENDAAFGRPQASRGRSAFPQIRFLALLENGTHVLFGAVLGSYRTSENHMAETMVAALERGMLCLADRGFFSYALWSRATGRGADLLWRVKKDIRLPCQERLPDGSYLSRVQRPGRGREEGDPGILVRVIEYTVARSGRPKERYRLVTSILDANLAPAQELAALYHERWEVETSLRELKTCLRGSNVVLRSKLPDLVRQEFYALLLAHFAARALMHEAALQADEDPDRLSFTHTIQVLRRRLPLFGAIPPSEQAFWAQTSVG